MVSGGTTTLGMGGLNKKYWSGSNAERETLEELNQQKLFKLINIIGKKFLLLTFSFL